MDEGDMACRISSESCRFSCSSLYIEIRLVREAIYAETTPEVRGARRPRPTGATWTLTGSRILWLKRLIRRRGCQFVVGEASRTPAVLIQKDSFSISVGQPPCSGIIDHKVGSLSVRMRILGGASDVLKAFDTFGSTDAETVRVAARERTPTEVLREREFLRTSTNPSANHGVDARSCNPGTASESGTTSSGPAIVTLTPVHRATPLHFLRRRRPACHVAAAVRASDLTPQRRLEAEDSARLKTGNQRVNNCSQTRDQQPRISMLSL